MSKYHRLLPRKTKEGLSPQRSAAREREALAKQAHKGITLDVNFLLATSDSNLGSYELARLAEFADLRSEMQVLVDRMVDTLSQAAVAAWFRTQDRQSLRAAIEYGPDVVELAKQQLRKQNRQPEEGQGKLPSPSLFRPSLPPGAAHLAAALRYQQRQIADGKCSVCPQPLDRNSVRYCTEHLEQARERKRLKRDLDKPPQGRAAGTLKALKEARERQTKTTPEERALWDRVAKQLGLSTVHVRNVATGQRTSAVVTAALQQELRAESQRLMRGEQSQLSPRRKRGKT